MQDNQEYEIRQELLSVLGGREIFREIGKAHVTKIKSSQVMAYAEFVGYPDDIVQWIQPDGKVPKLSRSLSHEVKGWLALQDSPSDISGMMSFFEDLIPDTGA